MNFLYYFSNFFFFLIKYTQVSKKLVVFKNQISINEKQIGKVERTNLIN